MYRKFSAEDIYTGHELLQQHVVITNTKGTIIDIVTENEAGDDVEKLKGLLSPGFINCHCHLELSHMKGHIPKYSGLVDFVLKVVNERHFEEQEILSAVEAAETEMLQNGIVAVGDICNNPLTIPQKIKGRIRYHNFIEASGFPPAVAELRFKRAVDLYNAYSNTLPANSIVPHAPYSVSPEMFKMIDEFPGSKLLTIHNQEVAAENELFEKGAGDFLRLYETMGIDISFFKPSGKSSLQTFLPYFKKVQSLILVHNVCTAEKDIAFIKLQTTNSKPQTVFCLCPNANLYISNLLPDVEMLMQNDVNIVLGTDSLASNDQLSILEEMKTLQKNFPGIELATLLKWATINGAQALQMDETLGSFEKGKQPGIVLIEALDQLLLTAESSSRRIL
ncbi:MAG: amidohydrolase family protein [Chitinophagaceae bacterium]|nr:amidohydrolase family protein [Chitinophagaceae bacterium]